VYGLFLNEVVEPLLPASPIGKRLGAQRSQGLELSTFQHYLLKWDCGQTTLYCFRAGATMGEWQASYRRFKEKVLKKCSLKGVVGVAHFVSFSITEKETVNLKGL
jgi:hypothetical protein